MIPIPMPLIGFRKFNASRNDLDIRISCIFLEVGEKESSAALVGASAGVYGLCGMCVVDVVEDIVLFVVKRIRLIPGALTRAPSKSGETLIAPGGALLRAASVVEEFAASAIPDMKRVMQRATSINAVEEEKEEKEEDEEELLSTIRGGSIRLPRAGIQIFWSVIQIPVKIQICLWVWISAKNRSLGEPHLKEL